MPAPDQHRIRTSTCRGLILVLALATGGLSALPAAAARYSSGKPLVGTFKLNPGACSGVTVSGSYFRLILPGGSAQQGRYFFSSASTCSNQSYTPLAPGTAGGLRTGQYQRKPSAGASAGAPAVQILQSQRIGSMAFSVETNADDPESGKALPAPRIVESKGHLNGQLEAWSMVFSTGPINQGTPKPGLHDQKQVSTMLGTYDASTHAFLLSWTSTFVGGPFNGFIGSWHLEGTFVPAPKAKPKAVRPGHVKGME